MEDLGAPSGGNDLGGFLRARRAALDPRRAGLPDDGRLRRVSGLRREELPLLANVSVDYIVWLEQGRTRRVSRPVLDALADALQLTPDERTYLAAWPKWRPPPGRERQQSRRSPRSCGSYSKTCTTSPRWSCTGAWTCWPGTAARAPSSRTSARWPLPSAICPGSCSSMTPFGPCTQIGPRPRATASRSYGWKPGNIPMT